jgi:hypothetical protein
LTSEFENWLVDTRMEVVRGGTSPAATFQGWVSVSG